MKRKIFLSLLVVPLVLSLIGCIPTIPGVPEWMRAEDEVYSYWKAIINRQYELAQWYCISDGVWHNKTDEWEKYINTNSEGEASLLISEPIFYKQTEIIGEDIYDPDIRDEAIAYVKIITHKIPFPDSNTIYTDIFEYKIELHKQSGDWKLK